MRLILDTKELEGIKDEVRTMGPRIRRKYLKDAGEILLDELQASARSLTRSRMHGFRKRDLRIRHLADAFSMKLEFKQNEGRVVITNPKPYASIHETGGRIEGRRMPIPLSGEGYFASRMIMNSVYGDSNIFVAKGKNKVHDLIWRKRQGRGLKALPMFVLKDQVTIKSQQYITRAMWRATPRIDAMLGQMEIWSG